MTAILRFCWSGIILLLPFLHKGQGFAAWLVDRKIGCWTYLTEGEVIMNSKVKAASDSRHPDIHLQVFRNGELMMPDPATSAYPILSSGETVELKLYTPQAMERIDTQFVVETTAGAEFTAPYIGCEGKRSAGKSKNSIMTLKFNDEEVETVEIVAGWATGHSAVTLTPKLIFKREDPGELTQKHRIDLLKDYHEDDGKPILVSTEMKIPEILDTNLTTPEENFAKVTEVTSADIAINPPGRKRATEQLKVDQDQLGNGLHRIISPENRKRKSKVTKESHFFGSTRLFQKLQRITNERNNDGFGSLSFSMHYFLYACVFSLLFILGVIHSASGSTGEQKDL
jgi:hypothetical protein